MGIDEVVQESLKKSGTRVRLRFDPTQVGECTGRSQDDGDGLLVQVRFAGKRAQFQIADDLELADVDPDDFTVIREGYFARSGSLRKRLTAVQLGGRLSELIYSLDTTNTEFMPHQFKPLLALLESPSKGLLIADEVGLGKTIEAGLIWTELRFRTNATRLLIICPAMLTEKWKQELSHRFGTHAKVMGAGELLDCLESGVAAPMGSAIICSLQGIRPPSDWDDVNNAPDSRTARLARKLSAEGEFENTLFDLTVIDEAHYLRNRDTSSALLGRLLRPVSDHFVLLSATPVNTRNSDLFNLVSLVDPDQFPYPNMFDQILDANRPLVQAANQLKRRHISAQAIIHSLDAAAGHWLLNTSASLSLLRKELQALPPSRHLSAEERVDISQRIERVNLLGQVVVRTRKRDVFENRVERKPVRLAAVMSYPEQVLYRAVTEAIRSYALENQGVEGFLLAMPQRQMASSMYAAAKRWIGPLADSEDMDELAFEAFDVVDSGSASPIVAHVAKAVSRHADLRALRLEDSKFSLLLDLLRRHRREYPGEKLLLFSYFRDTLAYLRERLEEEGIPALVVKGGDNKQALIDEFRESDRYRVLLASEVASEGVDLQFMRVVVNYDLPWNPMKVEQRIGRIDRIGQKADTISIVNMVYAETIDDRILDRLYMRLKLFEDSLGCTEEVLGDSISKMTKSLLSARLSPSQEEARIEDTRAAIERRRKDMAQVEESEADLMGLGDYVRSRVSKARETQRRITDADLIAHIRDYLEDYAQGYVLRMDPNHPLLGVLKLPPEIAARLERFREQRRLVKSKLESGHEIQVVIRNHVSAGNVSGKYELVNQYHPLVGMIASEEQVGRSTVPHSVELSASRHGLAVPEGKYVFVAESWHFKGARDEETVGALFRSFDGNSPMSADSAFDLLNALRVHGTDWVDPGIELPAPEEALALLDAAHASLTKRFKEEQAVHEAENADRVRIQRQTLERNAQRRRASLEERLSKAEFQGQKTVIQLTRGQLRKLDEHTRVALAKVDGRAKLEIRREPLVDGFMRVLS